MGYIVNSKPEHDTDKFKQRFDTLESALEEFYYALYQSGQSGKIAKHHKDKARHLEDAPREFRYEAKTGVNPTGGGSKIYAKATIEKNSPAYRVTRK